MQLHCDMSTIHISKNLVFHERAKYIETACHFIRRKVMHGITKPKYINNKEQIAKMYTKALHPIQAFVEQVEHQYYICLTWGRVSSLTKDWRLKELPKKY